MNRGRVKSHFETTYNTHYYEKEIIPFSRYVTVRTRPEFDNTITQDYPGRKYLKINKTEFDKYEEDYQKYKDNFCSAKRKICDKNNIETIDLDYMDSRENCEYITTYMDEILGVKNLRQYRKEQEETLHFKLPEDHEIPMTEQQSAYRPQTLISPDALNVDRAKAPETVIEFGHEHSKDIQYVPMTEYQEAIANRAGLIVEHELLGKIDKDCL